MPKYHRWANKGVPISYFYLIKGLPSSYLLWYDDIWHYLKFKISPNSNLILFWVNHNIAKQYSTIKRNALTWLILGLANQSTLSLNMTDRCWGQWISNNSHICCLEKNVAANISLKAERVPYESVLISRL